MKLPEIISEIGVNYYDIAKRLSLTPVNAAKKMVLECKLAGVKTVKFQTYKAEKLAAEYSPSYWNLDEEPTTSQRKLFSKFDKLNDNDYSEIAKYCRQLDIEFMSTPFDLEYADFINQLVLRHKIASADITNYPLLTRIAEFKKPVILSVGSSNLDEIKSAVGHLKDSGCKDLTLLHCVLSYPTDFKDANLWKIASLKKYFPKCKIGISDHTRFSLDVLTTAWILGAEVIEKHFTLYKDIKGNDHYHAADVTDFKQLIGKLEFLKEICGEQRENWVLDCEQTARLNARRGVYLTKDVKKGGKIQYDHVAILRPQLDGITPQQLVNYIENSAQYSLDIQKDTLIKAQHLVCA